MVKHFGQQRQAEPEGEQRCGPKRLDGAGAVGQRRCAGQQCPGPGQQQHQAGHHTAKFSRLLRRLIAGKAIVWGRGPLRRGSAGFHPPPSCKAPRHTQAGAGRRCFPAQTPQKAPSAARRRYGSACRRWQKAAAPRSPPAECRICGRKPAVHRNAAAQQAERQPPAPKSVTAPASAAPTANPVMPKP